MGLRWRNLWLGVPLLLAGPTPGAAWAQERAQKPRPPAFEVDVALVAVPVFVTDGSGKAVPGLSPQDFELHDGGRLVSIAAFQAVDVDAPVAAAAPELPAAVQAAAPRQFLLLFDLQFSPFGGVTRARAAAARFVRESLSPSDLVAVATFGRGGLKVLTSFTSDRRYVARAIEGLGLVSAIESGADPLGLSGEFAGGGMSSVDAELTSELALMRQAMLRDYVQKVNSYLMEIAELAQALSRLRGRKQIVLFSGGFDNKAWAGPESIAEQWDDPQWMAVQARMNAMFRMAGHSDVVIHSVALTGLETSVDVASRTGRRVGMGAGRGALAALAANTGGRFVLPTNDLDRALEEVDQISRHSYVLAFQPAEPAPKRGERRRLKVRVRRPGLTVSHRADYVVPESSSQGDALRLAAAEAIGKGLSGGPLGLRLVSLPYRDREGGATLPAVLHIDGPALAAAARDGGLVVQVYGYALTAGRVLDSLFLETKLDLSKVGPSLRSGGFHLLTAFAVSPGSVDLRFFVRAGPSGATGSIRRQVEVPTFAGGQAVLSAPVLTLPTTGRIAVPFGTRGGPRLEIPFRLGGAPFVPDAPSLRPGRASDLCVFVWRARAGSNAPLVVTGEMARPGETPLPLRIEGAPRVVADDDGFDRHVVTVVPPQAAAGSYALHLTFRDPGTAWTAHSETMVSLEE